MKVVDLENHFSTPTYKEALRRSTGYPHAEQGRGIGFFDDTWIPELPGDYEGRLTDLGAGRIKAMDDAGIDVAVLSLLASGVEPLEPNVGVEVAHDTNDRLAAATSAYPDRLIGTATVPVKDIQAALAELERCGKQLGFKIWLAHSNFGDSYLDEKRYWPLLAKAQELDMPIYLHPTAPMIPDLRTFGYCLAGPAFGFGVEVAWLFLRMVTRGVFDEFPRLKVILGHFGEALPFLLDRVDTAYRQGYARPRPEIGPGSKHPASYYVKNNMWATSSGNYLPAAYICTRDALGLDKVCLATDYPFEKFRAGVDFMEELPISAEERAQVCGGNAERLLGL